MLDESNCVHRFLCLLNLQGIECCSDRAITYHYVSPEMMITLEYLIYRVKPYGEDSNLWLETVTKPNDTSNNVSNSATDTASIAGINSRIRNYHEAYYDYNKMIDFIIFLE